MSARTPMRTRINGGWEPDQTALLEELYQFALIMRGAPFANRSGLRGVSAFALFWSLRRVEPDVVFEVGVWRSFGTWLIEQVVPGAQLHCLNPMVMLRNYMSRWKLGRSYISPVANYSAQDFSCTPIDSTFRT